jgi:hypothetical protein
MRILTLLIFATISCLASAQELVFVNPVANCIATSDKGVHIYEAGAVIQNVTDRKIIISTGKREPHTSGPNVGGQYSDPKEHYFFWGTMITTKMFGVQMAPSVSELNLVELYPGEGYYLRGTTESKEEVSRAYFRYTGHPLLEGRFGTWKGETVSEPIDVGSVKDCKLPKV